MASRSLNRVTLIGNLTRDPELKYTPQGTAVCTFGVATNRSWSTSSGELKEDTQFHRIVAWQKLAELCGKLLSKGKKVYLEGRIAYRTYTGKDGIQRTITEIILDDFILFNNQRKTTTEPPEDISLKEEAKEEKKKEKEEEEGEGEGEKEAKEEGEETEKTKEESTEEQTNKDKEEIDPDDIPF